MSNNLQHTTDASFEIDVIQSETPVLVDFWAEWCGPCKAIAPLLEDLAEQFSGKLVIAKLDVDSNPTTPAKYGIRGIPTLILFKGGASVAQKVGMVSKTQLAAFIEAHI